MVIDAMVLFLAPAAAAFAWVLYDLRRREPTSDDARSAEPAPVLVPLTRAEAAEPVLMSHEAA